MKILVDNEGGQLMADMVHTAMKAGAYGWKDIKALFVLQTTIEPIGEERSEKDA